MTGVPAGDPAVPGPAGSTGLPWRRLGRATLGAVAAHPSLWPVAVRTVLRLAAPGWWRRRPRLPLPAEQYWQFRLVTAYGGSGEDVVPDSEDVVAYLRWCRGLQTAGG